MINLIWGSSFRKAYKKVTEVDPSLKLKIAKALEMFAGEPFHPALRTHKLSGRLKGLWAFVADYDCRIVFQFLKGGDALLIDIGKHDEVY